MRGVKPSLLAPNRSRLTLLTHHPEVLRRLLELWGPEVLNQSPDVPDPLRMSAHELAELNDCVLVYEEGLRVQHSF